MVGKVHLSAQPPADRSVRRLIRRRRRTAPVDRWAARHCSGPPGERTRARTDAAPVRSPPPPRGLTRKAPAALRFARAISSCHPSSPSRGLCGSLALLEVSGYAALEPSSAHGTRARSRLPQGVSRETRGTSPQPLGKRHGPQSALLLYQIAQPLASDGSSGWGWAGLRWRSPLDSACLPMVFLSSLSSFQTWGLSWLVEDGACPVWERGSTAASLH